MYTGNDTIERKYGREHGAAPAIKPYSRAGWGDKSIDASEYIEGLLGSLKEEIAIGGQGEISYAREEYWVRTYDDNFPVFFLAN